MKITGQQSNSGGGQEKRRQLRAVGIGQDPPDTSQAEQSNDTFHYPRVTIGPRRSKPRHLQFTPIRQLGDTLLLEAKKTQATQPIHAGLN